MWVGLAFLWLPSSADAESSMVAGAQPHIARAHLDFAIVIPKVARLQLGASNVFGANSHATRNVTQRAGGSFAQSATNAGDVSLVMHQAADDYAPVGTAGHSRRLQRATIYTLALP